MAMMYRIIAQALEKSGQSEKYHPQDYLNFYCLGKREPLPSPIKKSSAGHNADSSGLVSSFIIYSFSSRPFEIKQ